MEAFLGCFAGLFMPVQEIFVLSLAALVRPVQNIFFLAIHYSSLFVPIDQKPRQAVMQGRLSLIVCLRLRIYTICSGQGRPPTTVIPNDIYLD